MGAIDTKGGRIGVLERGAGSAALPILFLHGVGSDKSVWRPQMDHFGATRRAIALDYPGYAESEFRAGATRDDFAAAVAEAMDALGIERAHICGLSLGGVVAIALYNLDPTRCASLILADSFAVHPEGQAIHDRSVEASRTIGMAALAEARAPLLMGKRAQDDAAMCGEVIATMSHLNPAAYRLGATAVWLADQRDRASAIAVPTLVMVGDEDGITPPALSEELARLISGARLERIAGAGHLANIESPGDFNRAIDRFLSEIE